MAGGCAVSGASKASYPPTASPYWPECSMRVRSGLAPVPTRRYLTYVLHLCNPDWSKCRMRIIIYQLGSLFVSITFMFHSKLFWAPGTNVATDWHCICHFQTPPIELKLLGHASVVRCTLFHPNTLFVLDWPESRLKTMGLGKKTVSASQYINLPCCARNW